MLKKSIALVLLIAFMVQAFSKIFIVIDYNINTAAYEAKCINKANLTLKCKGKCQMMKAIEHESQKEQQYPDRRGENKYDITISDQNYFPNTHQKINFSTDFVFPEYQSDMIREATLSIFHPPC